MRNRPQFKLFFADDITLPQNVHCIHVQIAPKVRLGTGKTTNLILLLVK